MNRHFNRRESAVGQKRPSPNGRFWRKADILRNAQVCYVPTSDITAPCPIETVDERVEVGVAAPRRAGDLPATKRVDSLSRLRLRTSLRDEPIGSHILVVIAG